jgi:hypothetical protein
MKCCVKESPFRVRRMNTLPCVAGPAPQRGVSPCACVANMLALYCFEMTPCMRPHVRHREMSCLLLRTSCLGLDIWSTVRAVTRCITAPPLPSRLLNPGGSLRIFPTLFDAWHGRRTESTPRLYNVLEVWRDHSKMQVHTCCLGRDGGPGKVGRSGRIRPIVAGAGCTMTSSCRSKVKSFVKSLSGWS